MPTLEDVLKDLELFAPSIWADSWDNPGLQVGNELAAVSKIAVSLDITEECLRFAEEQGCDLLISHHPLLLDPLKKLTLNSHTGKIIARAVRCGIGLVSLHTNWDVAPKGVNAVLAQLLGLSPFQPLGEGENGAWGIGAVGNMSQSLDFHSFISVVRQKWALSWAKGYKASEKPVHKVALCGGSGSSLVPLALSHDADIFITADMKYHQMEEALSHGLNLCVVDHGEMESLSLPALAGAVKEATGLPVEVIGTPTLPQPVISAIPSVFLDNPSG